MNKRQVLEKAIRLFEGSTEEQKTHFLGELKTELTLELANLGVQEKLAQSQLMGRMRRFLEKKDNRPDYFRKAYKLLDGRFVISNGSTLVIVYKELIPPPMCYVGTDAEPQASLERFVKNVIAGSDKSQHVEFVTSKNLKILKKVDLAEVVEIQGNMFLLNTLQQVCDTIGDFSIYPGRGFTPAYFKNDLCEGVISKLNPKYDYNKSPYRKD